VKAGSATINKMAKNKLKSFFKKFFFSKTFKEDFYFLFSQIFGITPTFVPNVKNK
jgi:hypothetical protein